MKRGIKCILSITARCVAQSCQPNLKGVIGVGKDEVPVIQVVTTREIQPGEVLSFDYVGQNCNRKLKLVSKIGELFRLGLVI